MMDLPKEPLTGGVRVGAEPTTDGRADATFDALRMGSEKVRTMVEMTETKSQPKVPAKAKTMKSL
jgi:hypothetical protein